jgi:hypothetical protein
MSNNKAFVQRSHSITNTNLTFSLIIFIGFRLCKKNMGLFMPTIDIGSRQNNRMILDLIFSCGNDKNDIMESIIFLN